MPPQYKPLLREAVTAAVLGGLVIAVLSWPAFDSFFFGEDFTHWGSYVAHDHEFWPAVFSAHGHIFFRPAVKAFGILSNQLLTPSPWVYHLRNWVGLCACLFVLGLLLGRLVASPMARALGIALFAISKVHLTVIGYVLIADAIFGLLQSLLTLYALVLYLQTRNRWALVASLVFFTLSIGSRDYSVALLAAVVAAWFLWRPERSDRPGLRDAFPLSVYAAISAAYFALRAGVVATPPPGSLYIPHFDAAAIWRRGAILLGNFWNASLGESYESGGDGLAPWLAELVLPGAKPLAAAGETAFVVVASALFLFTVIRATRPLRLVPAAIWVAGFAVPPLLIQNIQVYYLFEPLGGLCLLAALALDSVPSPKATLSGAWVAVLLFAALNTFAHSQRVELHPWRHCATHARQAYDTIQAELDPLSPPRRIQIYCENDQRTAFWQYTVRADGQGPMFPYLLQIPSLEVAIQTLPDELPEPPPRTITLIEREGQLTALK